MYPAIPDNLAELDDYLSERESGYDLKPGTEAQIDWNCGSTLQKTEYALVYLHGFRASHPEGDPVHKTIAEHFGCNLYLSRHQEHGIDTKYPLLHLTEEKLRQSARFAYEIGKRIGDKVILMGTSTGASLALYLAAQADFQDHISSLILYSPLVRFHGIKEQLLMHAASRKMLSVIPGRQFVIKTESTTYAEDRIWNNCYALGGALALGAFIQHTMTNDLFRKVRCPTFIGYYYKNNRERDKVVSISGIKKLAEKLQARTTNVSLTNFPEAQNHVICSSLVSKSVPAVIDHTKKFLKNLVSHTSRDSN